MTGKQCFYQAYPIILIYFQSDTKTPITPEYFRIRISLTKITRVNQ